VGTGLSLCVTVLGSIEVGGCRVYVTVICLELEAAAEAVILIWWYV